MSAASLITHFAFLCPLYVIVFWMLFLLLTINKRNRREGRQARWMLCCLFVLELICHGFRYILYRQFPFPPYSSVVYYFSTLLVFPMFYMYILAITDGIHFSWKTFGFSFFPATLWTIFYLAAARITPYSEFHTFIMNWNVVRNPSVQISMVKILLDIKTVLYILQMALLIYWSVQKIRKADLWSLHYYSSLVLPDCYNVKSLLNLMIAFSAAIFMALFMNVALNPDVSMWMWVFFKCYYTIVLFVIGLYGLRQSRLLVVPTQVADVDMVLSEQEAKMIEEKLNYLMQDKKIYLIHNLTIVTIAQYMELPTEHLVSYFRKEASTHYYCYINRLRIEELKRNIALNIYVSDTELAEHSGFGTVKNMNSILQRMLHMKISEFKILVKR